MDTNVKRGEIYYADLSPVVGSEQGGVRPVLIVQNDTGNRHSPTVIAAAITSQMGKAKLPTHIEVAAQCCGLPKDSVILLEQIRTLDKRRLRERMGRVDGAVMERVDDDWLRGFIPHGSTYINGILRCFLQAFKKTKAFNTCHCGNAGYPLFLLTNGDLRTFHFPFE